jgi:hypothetical protein
MALLTQKVAVTTQHSTQIYGIIFKIFIFIFQFHDPYEASDHPNPGQDSDFEFLLYNVNTYSNWELTMSERKQYTTVPYNRTKYFTENYFQLQGSTNCLNPLQDKDKKKITWIVRRH